MEMDINSIIDYLKNSILEDKRRLDLIEATHNNNNVESKTLKCDNEETTLLSTSSQNLLSSSSKDLKTTTKKNENVTFIVEPLDLNNNSNNNNINNNNNNKNSTNSINNNNVKDIINNKNDGLLEKNKQEFIDKIINSDNPLTFRSEDNQNTMLRYGEYSPNNPQLRVSAAPYLGLGEYDQRRKYYEKRQKDDYARHLEELAKKTDINLKFSTKAVQTDLKNIHCPIIQYDENKQDLNNYMDTYNNRSLTHQHHRHGILKTDMETKPKSILTNRRSGNTRDRIATNSYTSSSFMDGFSYTDGPEQLERERLKCETYQRDLRLQIEEKRRIQTMREEQERHEQELGNRRLEQQLLRMQEEQMIEDQIRRNEHARRHSDDLLRRKHELQNRLRKHTDSESSVTNLRNTTNSTNVASTKTFSHYSPPVSRRNPYSFNIPSTSVFSEPSTFSSSNRYNRFDSSYYRKDALNRMDSLNNYNAFNRYDSLSRIDLLNRQDTLNKIETLNLNETLQRRHSATQQDLSEFKLSPKLQRRSISSRFDDNYPIPILKAHSPVAKELKNSIPFNSSKHCSDAIRRLEDKWQIPAVQKNIVNYGQNRSILTQLGAIRKQLQQEQLRMDETLRKRNFTQPKAVDFH